jgi:hypothetical protein
MIAISTRRKRRTNYGNARKLTRNEIEGAKSGAQTM